MKIGKRTIKTCIAVFISLAIFLLLQQLNKLLGFNEPSSFYVTSKEYWYVPTNFYTPFFASIAVCYAMGQSKEQSLAQAKLRSIGSIVGGYFGYIIIVLFSFVNNLFHFTKGNIDYNLLLYLIVSIGIIILMNIIRKTNTAYAGFIACLTYLSVTVSIRNGGMEAFLFTNNRILSTIIGVLIALYINTFPHIRFSNNKILFLVSLDNALYNDENKIDEENIHVIRDICNTKMKMTYMSSRPSDYIVNSFRPCKLRLPMIVMNGAAIYHPLTNEYTDIKYISKESAIIVKEIIEEEKINAFSYVYNEGNFVCYYDSLEEPGSRTYFNKNKHNQILEVEAKVKDNLQISMFSIVNKAQIIDRLYEKFKTIDDLLIYTYNYKYLEGYKILRLMPKTASKKEGLEELRKYIDFDYIVCVGGRNFDLDAIEASDFSICRNGASKVISDKVDLVINSRNPHNIINVLLKIYHSPNYLRLISSLKKL